ncbi:MULTISPECIES: SpoIIE family protein phosphatase [unclassified Streptomyces]|uniref:SpoIIE family protein phosphatase n=1 Tax=unclassified Streptomyces TaxID=2593676 RepID=UPI002E300F37|nr:SpoIIE family protein phosphatase [Streptomyces sp. NBC_01280]WSE13562.1 SpoIIE family protein phosphatase [Streptomyces sp. NBC_01397]
MARSDLTASRSDLEAALIEALFTQSPVGLHLLNTDLHVVRFNTATALARSVPVEDILGRPFTETYGLVEPDEIEALVRGVLVSGVPAIDRIVRLRPRAAPEREHRFAVSVFRLQNDRGVVLGLAAAVVDVTERERARQRLNLLAAARDSVGRTLDAGVTCQELADIVVPDFADTAVVEVVDSAMRGEEPPPAPLPAGVQLRRAAFSSRVPNAPQAHPVGHIRDVPGPTPDTEILSDLRPRVVRLHADLPWLAADPTRAQAIHASGAHTLLITPMTLRGAVLGLISLYLIGEADPYDEDDIALALDLANHTALCIDNARRYTREHTIATTLERRLLPDRAVPQTALGTAGMPIPSEGAVGWYDTIALPGARTALVVGEIAGQGIHVTAAVGQLRTVVRSLAAFDLEPDELIARLDDTATLLAAERASLPSGDSLHHEVFAATCTYAIYDPLALTCTAASAGRPTFAITLPDGTTRIPDIPAGPQLGAVDRAPFAANTFAIPEGGILAMASPSTLSALPSDPELVQRSPAGADQSLEEILDAIVSRLLATDAGSRAAAVLLARPRGFPSECVATWQLSADPTATATARHHVHAQLATWNMDEETAFNTELIVSELVTNAVRHGSPPTELRLIHGRTLTCEVRDTSPAAPHLRHARTVDEGGRGLFIVAQIAQVWGTRYNADGKTVWTEQTLP